MNRKKFLIVSALFPPEPVVSAKLSFDIASSLSQYGHVTVLCPAPSRPEGFKFDKFDDTSINDTDVVRMDSYIHPHSDFFGRLIENISFGIHASRYIRDNYKVISCIYVNSWPLFSQKAIVKSASKYGIPVVMHIQDIYPESLLPKTNNLLGKMIFSFLLPLDKYLLMNSDAIIAVSANMKKKLSSTRQIPDDKITVIQNWQNEEEFTTYDSCSHERKTAPFTFMYLGNNGPVAGVDFLIHSFGKSGISKARLVIAGSGSQTERCKSIAASYSESDIEFVSVPDGEVPSIQSMADVMLLPVKVGAAMSSIPSKLPAYMFSSKPIIGSLDIESDTARIIIDSDCGLVVRPENEEELVCSMRNMMSKSHEELMRLGRNGFSYAMDNLSKKNNIQKLISIINDCKATK